MPPLRASLVSAAVLLQVLATAAQAQGEAADAAPPRCSAEACRVSVDRLSTQDLRPFRFAGTVMDPGQPGWADFRGTITRYEDARACLLPEEQERSDPDLLAMDWQRVRGIDERDVCLFRIFTTFDDIASVEAWLRHHDFGAVQRFDAMQSPIAGEAVATTGLWGSWDEEAWYAHTPSRLYDWLGLAWTSGATILVMFASDGRVLEVDLAPNGATD